MSVRHSAEGQVPPLRSAENKEPTPYGEVKVSEQMSDRCASSGKYREESAHGAGAASEAFSDGASEGGTSETLIYWDAT